MASLDLTAADAILKQLYDYGRVNELAYKDHAFLAMVPKYERFAGRNRVIPIRYGRGQGRSSTFATAQSQATASKYDDFLITMTSNYGVATIDGLTSEVSANDRGSFVSGMANEIDGIIQEVSRDMSRNIFRTTVGDIGQVGTSGITTTSLTLAQVADSHNFEVNMEVQATRNLTALLDSGNSATVTAVNRATGVLTTDSNWTSQISGLTDDDYLLQKGDLATKMAGLGSWLPTSAPSSGESFFGVDRSNDSRKYGIYYDGSSESSIEDALIEAQSRAAVQGGRPDCCFMNNANYRALIKALGTKVNYDLDIAPGGAAGRSASIAFRSVVIEGDAGPIKVYADRDCPVNTAYILQKDTWELNSVGQAPKILMLDGLRIQRQATSDGYEVRVGAYVNLACDFPGANARVALPTS